jgi:hypothetical protein
MKCVAGTTALLAALSLATAAPARAQGEPPAPAAQPATSPGLADKAPSAEPDNPPPAPPAPEPPLGLMAPDIAVNPPAVDTPSASAASGGPKPSARPFADSSLYVTNSITTGTIFRGQQLYSNPTVEGSVWILPRYAISEAFQLRGRVIVSYEYTNSDTTTYQNEPQLSDTTLYLFYRKIPKLPGEITPNLGLHVSLPTSKVSRSRTMLFSPGVTLQLGRTFEKMLGGTGHLLATGVYSHPFYQSTNPEVVDPRPPGAFQCVGGNGCQDLLSGTMNASDTLSYALLFEMKWGRWNPALYYLGASQWVYSPGNAVNPIDGTPIGRPDGFVPTSVRQTHYLSAWLDYDFNTWLTGEVGYWNSVSALGADGQQSNLVFSRYQDTRIYLGASIQLDNLVKSVQGVNDGAEAGIPRAKNTKQPMWTF